MNFPKNNSLGLFSNSNIQDDVLLKKILLTHAPDKRWLDSETMLHVVGNIMFHASATQVYHNIYIPHMTYTTRIRISGYDDKCLLLLLQVVPSIHFTSISKDDICNIELLGCREPVGCIIRKISCEVFHVSDSN